MRTRGDATDLDGLTGTEEAAPVLGVTGKAVRVMCEKGILPAVLIGRRYVMRKTDVTALACERGARR